MLNVIVTAVKKPNTLKYTEGNVYEAYSIGGGFYRIMDADGGHILAPLAGSTIEFAIVE